MNKHLTQLGFKAFSPEAVILIAFLNMQYSLTLSMLEEKLCRQHFEIFFSCFSQEIGFDISCNKEIGFGILCKWPPRNIRKISSFYLLILPRKWIIFIRVLVALTMGSK